FHRFDYVLAMDSSNYQALIESAHTEELRAKVRLFRSFDSEAPEGAEVPDPYYGGPNGFVQVLEICEAACLGLLEHLRRDHAL
ncbi:MAG: low molecular weight phosphotyrosine protein phosphatase, partial [Deltaproteobacteria bacterium]|nr:low molecular weight phosphotyrosine protein phosphatase [Deltaproteobacteria bacterium]